MPVHSIFKRWVRTTDVRAESMAKMAAIAALALGGVEYGRRTAPIRTVKVRVIAPAQATATPITKRAKDSLPATLENLPEVGTPQFNREIREMGLNPAQVERFAMMLETEGLRAGR